MYYFLYKSFFQFNKSIHVSGTVESGQSGSIVPTQSRSVLEVGVVLDKVLGLVSGEQAGLDEADQGVDLPEVVLDRSPSEQNPETHRELGEHQNDTDGKKTIQRRMMMRRRTLKRRMMREEENDDEEVLWYLAQGLVEQGILVLQSVSLVHNQNLPFPTKDQEIRDN